MMTANSVAIMNRGRMRIAGNSGITLFVSNVTAPVRASLAVKNSGLSVSVRVRLVKNSYFGLGT